MFTQSGHNANARLRSLECGEFTHDSVVHLWDYMLTFLHVFQWSFTPKSKNFESLHLPNGLR